MFEITTTSLGVLLLPEHRGPSLPVFLEPGRPSKDALLSAPAG